jgi:acyl carrier protein
MNDTDKLYTAFATGLHIDLARITDDLSYESIPEWDSVGHMALVVEIEGAFDVMLDTDDIVNLSSVAKAKEILAKYDVKF